jgi:uncharacterized protein YfbU (UPF0304 family)
MENEEMADLLSDISSVYTVYQTSFSQIYGACTTDQQRSTVLAQYTAARDAYWAAAAKTLSDNNSVVQSIDQQLQAANAQVAQSLANLQNIAAFISAAAGAIQLAASLVTLAASA